MRAFVIGAHGFVGSAFVRHLEKAGVDCVPVTREAYDGARGSAADVVIDAAGNSKKFWAEEQPFEEFDASVGHRLRVLRDFPDAFHIHISSVDVYPDLTAPATTREETRIDVEPSHYGFHKLLAEQLVRHHARRWLIVRLAGMVGPGLRKNPVFDILHGRPLRIHPDSQYQFLPTDFVASAVWTLFGSGCSGEIFNVCGDGLISPREIGVLAGRSLDLSLVPAEVTPRIVDASIDKLTRIMSVPRTAETVRQFASSVEAS